MSDPCLLGRTHWSDPLAVDYLALTLANLPVEQRVTIVCVGTDRSTGDSLGPLVGNHLVKKQELGVLPPHLTVHGTLQEPIHALNIADHVERLSEQEPDSTIIAIDACLGKPQSVGSISIKQGPLRPGTGVNKRLPSIGDYHIIGVVNVSGFMEHVVLQNTRLSLIFQMAEVIAGSILLGLTPNRSLRETALASPSLY